MEVALHKRALPSHLRGETPPDIAESLARLPEWFARHGELDLGTGPDLNVRKLAGSKGALWRLRVGRWRAIFQRVGELVLVLVVDLRKDVYKGELPTPVEDDIDEASIFDDERWRRLRVVRRDEGIQVIESGTATPETTGGPPAERRRARPRAPQTNPLTPFSDAELLRIAGLDGDDVAWLRTIPASIDVGAALGGRLDDPDVVAVVTDVWNRPGVHVDTFARGDVPSAETATIDDAELERRLRDDASRAEVVTAATSAQLERLLAASIEDWMVYLHPSQRRIAQARFNGPGRVRGGPGTGKTVVALHRARWLARQTDADEKAPVLLTTFLRTLPPVWDSLMELLDDRARTGIAFLGVDQLARRVVADAGAARPLIELPARQHLAGELVRRHALPPVFVQRPAFLLEEFDAFLSGRDTSDLADYLGLRRRGGGVRLARADRERVWAAYEEYRRTLDGRGLTDFALLRTKALRLAEDGHGPRFGGVIVDEAQDLTEVGVRLLHALDASPGHRGFLIVGDGQQSVYPGGFSLGQLGVDVRGRSRALSTNWRNTWSIWNAASAVVAGESFDDLDDEAGLRPVEDQPSPLVVGEDAILHVLRSPAEELELLAALVAERCEAGADPGDLAVLCAVRRKVSDVEDALRDAGVPVTPLDRYDGQHAEGVLVGTHRRAKGLEFKEVFVPGLAASEWPSRWFVPPDLPEDERRERLALELRQLFVAMTRPRDRLTLLSGGEPAGPLREAEWALEVRRY